MKIRHPLAMLARHTQTNTDSGICQPGKWPDSYFFPAMSAGKNVCICLCSSACPVECSPREMRSLFLWGVAYSSGVANSKSIFTVNLSVNSNDLFLYKSYVVFLRVPGRLARLF
jgi:hypothetical protein